MSSLTQERIAVVVITALLLWNRGLEPAPVAAAIVGVAFFWWFAGWRRPPDARAEVR